MKSHLLLFLICGSVLSAQEKVGDSLSNLLSQTLDPTNKLELLSEITNFYSQLDLDQAIVFARQGVRLADQTNNKNWQPKFYEMKGRIHANKIELKN